MAGDNKTTAAAWRHCLRFSITLLCVIQMVHSEVTEPSNADIMQAMVKITEEVKTLKGEMAEMKNLQNIIREQMEDEMQTYRDTMREKITQVQRATLDSHKSMNKEIISQINDGRINSNSLRDMLDIILVTTTLHGLKGDYIDELNHKIFAKYVSEFGSPTDADMLNLQMTVKSSFDRFRKPINCSANEHFFVVGSQHSSQCFFLPRYNTGQMNWTDANTVCEEQAGILAEPRSIPDFTKVLKEQDLVKRAQRMFFWLGASDLDVDGEMRWTSDKSMVNSDSWEWGEPGNPIWNGSPLLSCLFFNINFDPMSLADRGCMTTADVVCEYRGWFYRDS